MKKKFINWRPKYNVNEALFGTLDLEREYNLILKKQSKLSAQYRELVKQAIESDLNVESERE